MRQPALLCTAFLLAIFHSASCQVPASLRPFVTCHFGDGLAVVEKSPTPPAALGRTAMTLLGPRQVPITRGERLLFAYPDKSPFVRATVEQLPPKSYAQGKADFVSAFDKLIASDDKVQRNYSLKPKINGLQAEGFDKKELGGNVLGSYLLIDDAARTVVSIDFLNQPVEERSFSSLDQYTTLRDGFLNNYSSCVQANAHVSAAEGTSSAPSAPPKKASPAGKTTRKR